MLETLGHIRHEQHRELIPCPYCGGQDYIAWAQERGYAAVRCRSCALIYVNPRPTLDSIDIAVRTGSHGEDAQNLNVVTRRVSTRVARYRKVFARLFDDVWRRGQPISWLDVGAGYGEIVEAVTSLAPPGSRVVGLEPMRPKAMHAAARGLNVTQDYLRPTHPKVGFVSVVDVFSHVPSFAGFLLDIRSVLESGGELFLETGNLADLERRDDFPNELGLPDHLVFAGETHLRGYLEGAGFEVLRIERARFDGVSHTAKNIVKKALGRPVKLGLPFTSNYRQLLIRARLRFPGAPSAS